MKIIATTIIMFTLLCISFVHAQQNVPADFPKYQDTGDKIADNEAYNQAKKTWIATNPETYQSLGGQIETSPEANEVNTNIEDCQKEDESLVAIPDNCVTWQIVDAILIDENNQLNISEFSKQQADFKKEMLTKEVIWKISPDSILYILNDGQYTNHFKFEKTDSELKLFPHDDASCNTQVKNFQIEKWTDRQIIINMLDEDEGSTLFYQLILNPIF